MARSISIDAELLQDVIEAKFHSQANLSRESGIPRNTISSAVLLGKTGPVTFEKLCEACGLTDDELRLPESEGEDKTDSESSPIQTTDSSKQSAKTGHNAKTARNDQNTKDFWTQAPPLDWSRSVPRETELDRLKDQMGLGGRAADTRPVQVVTSINGCLGIGKSWIAQVVAHDHDIHLTFPHGIHWIPVGQPRTQHLFREHNFSALNRLGHSIGIDSILSCPDPALASRKIAQQLEGRSVLIILDDVWRPEDTKPFRDAVSGDSAVVVTTRLPGIAQEIAGPDSVFTLPELNSDSAFELLRKITTDATQQDENACRRLLSELGFLPLAIHVAAAVFERNRRVGVNVADTVNEILEGSTLFSSRVPEDLVDQQQHCRPAVSSLLDRSINQLSPRLQEYFKRLGHPRSKPDTIGIDAFQRLWGTDDVMPVISEFVESGLLEYSETFRLSPGDAGVQQFCTHQLIRMYARYLNSESP